LNLENNLYNSNSQYSLVDTLLVYIQDPCSDSVLKKTFLHSKMKGIYKKI
jgi:hypothetical protein